MLSYIDDFSITVALDSHRGNVRRLQRVFTDISEKGRNLCVSFSMPKTELVHWRTPSQRTPHATSPIELDDHIFQPSRVVRWLGYWLTPALTSAYHFRHKLSLGQAAFSFAKRLSSPGAGVSVRGVVIFSEQANVLSPFIGNLGNTSRETQVKVQL